MPPHTRWVAFGAVAALLIAALAPTTRPAAPPAVPRLNRIQQENLRPGSLDWQLTRVRLDKGNGYRSPLIEGYCSRQSVRAGDTLQFMVSTTPPAKFEIEIFRTGYYGGRGARLMKKLGPFQGKAQP